MRQNLLKEANDLIEEGRKKLEAGDIKGAAWRIADGLGTLREYTAERYPNEDIQGLDYPTGKNFQIMVSSTYGYRG